MSVSWFLKTSSTRVEHSSGESVGSPKKEAAELMAVRISTMPVFSMLPAPVVSYKEKENSVFSSTDPLSMHEQTAQNWLKLTWPVSTPLSVRSICLKTAPSSVLSLSSMPTKVKASWKSAIVIV